MLGDLAFALTRRVFLNMTTAAKPNIPSWSYLASHNYGTLILGKFHASDILTAYGITPTFASVSIEKYYISFYNTMDPNESTQGLPQWLKWSAGKQLLNSKALSNDLLADDFSMNSYNFINAARTSLHI